MLNLDLDGKYGDAMELGLFNSGLSGLSQEGTHYFYENKLESDGTHKRWAWHNCPCCTMNVSRLVASIGGYFYSTGKDLIAIHLYGGNSATIDLDGTTVAIKEESNFPWSGAVKISVNPKSDQDVHCQVAHPGLDQRPDRQDQWRRRSMSRRTPRRATCDRRAKWTAGDTVTMDLPMPVRRIYAHPRVRMDVGRVALSRGPLVYCIEQHDNGDTPVTRAAPAARRRGFGGGAGSARRHHGADGQGRRAQGGRLERRASIAPPRRPRRRRR